jgi:hypothetical protein
MKTNLKNMLYSLALGCAIISTPTWASDPADVIGSGPTTPAVVAINAAPVDDKGKGEAPTPAAVPLAVFDDADKALMQNAIGLLRQIYDEVQAKKTDPNFNEDQIIKDVFAQGGLASSGAEVFDDLVGKLNGLVQAKPAAAGTKMSRFQVCCGRASAEVDEGAQDLKAIFPILPKYFYFFEKEVNQHASPIEIMTDLAGLGMLQDLHTVMEAIQSHHVNALAAKATDQAVTLQLKAKKKK